MYSWSQCWERLYAPPLSLSFSIQLPTGTGLTGFRSLDLPQLELLQATAFPLYTYETDSVQNRGRLANTRLANTVMWSQLYNNL